MDRFTLDCLRHINPFATGDEIADYGMINQFDMLFVFKNGKRIIFDTTTNRHRMLYPKGHKLTDQENKKEFAIRLRALMKRACVNQKELAEYLGTNQVTISRYVNGDFTPDYNRLGEIARILNCTVDDFYYKEY